MSRPFACALLGLVFTIVVLAVGERNHFKGAVPVAFLVGGAMMIGGLAVGAVRALPRNRRH
jgi:hypothetical protein